MKDGFRKEKENIAKDRKVIPDPIDDRKFQEWKEFYRRKLLEDDKYLFFNFFLFFWCGSCFQLILFYTNLFHSFLLYSSSNHSISMLDHKVIEDECISNPKRKINIILFVSLTFIILSFISGDRIHYYNL